MKNKKLYYIQFIRKDIIMAILIITLPFVFYLYNLAPKHNRVWEIFLFKINSGTFYDVNVFLWNIFTKILIIAIISIWFITCKYWWRFALLLGLTIETFKLLGIFKEAYFINSKINLWIFVLPIAFIYSLLLIYISKKIGYYNYAKTEISQINFEVDKLLVEVKHFKMKDYKMFKQKLFELRKRKKKMNKKEYLVRIIVLRDQFENLI